MTNMTAIAIIITIIVIAVVSVVVIVIVTSSAIIIVVVIPSDLVDTAEVAALRAEDTRLSKKRANEKVNCAWMTHLAKSCGRFQLAERASEETRRR